MKAFKIFSIVLSLFIGLSHIKAQALNIKMATFNLRLDTPNDSLNAWPHRKEFVKNLIQYHDFDIIGTQEGFAHQIEGITELKDYASYGVGRDDGKKTGEHSAIIYKKGKFQLLKSGDFWLREDPSRPGKGWDAKCCNRISSWAQFKDKKSGKIFFVFNVHFDHEGVVARRESAKLMIKKIHEIAKNTPAILTGDFNSTPDSDAITTLKTAFSDSYEITKMPPYGPVGTFNGFKFNAALQDRIDYIFVTKTITVKKYAALTDFFNQRYPSDHLPVVADLTIQ